MWRVSRTPSKMQASQLGNYSHRNSRGWNKRRRKKKKPLFSTPSTRMLIELRSKHRRRKILRTQCVLTSNRDCVRRERSVFIPMILLWTEMKKSICMLTKEPSWLWIKSGPRTWTIWVRKSSVKWSLTRRRHLSRVWNQTSSVSTSLKLSRKTSTDGTGLVPMAVTVASISIVFLQDISWIEMVEISRSRWKRSISRKRLMRSVANSTEKEVTVFLFRSLGHSLSLHEMEGR